MAQKPSAKNAAKESKVSEGKKETVTPTPPEKPDGKSPTPKTQGAYRIFACKQDGDFFWTEEMRKRGDEPSNDPSQKGAREIYFGLRSDVDAVPTD